MRQKDLSNNLVASKEEEREIEDYATKLHFALTKPIIVFPSGGWEKDIPEWLKKEVPLHRMAQLIKEEEGKASDIECLIYLQPASLAFPFSREWTRIYMYLFAQVMGEEKAKEVLGNAVPELDDYEEKRKLDELKKWIWKKQWEEFKRREKSERNSYNRSRESKVIQSRFDEL